MEGSRISGAITRIWSPLGFFMLNLVAGSLLVAAVAPPSLYAVLGLLSLATLFSLLATLSRYSQGVVWERAALVSSSIGGFAMLMVPLFLLISQLSILHPFFSCWAVLFGCGPWPGPYYSIINRLMLTGIGSAFAALLYAMDSRGHIISAFVSGFSVWIFFNTISSTQISALAYLLTAPTVVGIVLMVRHVVGRARTRPPLPVKATRFIVKRMMIILLLAILVSGAVGCLWGLDTEAVESVQIACLTGWDGGATLTLGLLNPSYLPVRSGWNVTYTYSNPPAVRSDWESMQIPGHTTGYLLFSFEPTPPNATLSGTTFDASYESFMASFNQHFSPTMYAGHAQPPGESSLPPCTSSVKSG